MFCLDECPSWHNPHPQIWGQCAIVGIKEGKNSLTEQLKALLAVWFTAITPLALELEHHFNENQ